MSMKYNFRDFIGTVFISSKEKTPVLRRRPQNPTFKNYTYYIRFNT